MSDLLGGAFSHVSNLFEMWNADAERAVALAPEQQRIDWPDAAQRLAELDAKARDVTDNRAHSVILLKPMLEAQSDVLSEEMGSGKVDKKRKIAGGGDSSSGTGSSSSDAFGIGDGSNFICDYDRARDRVL